MSKKARKTIDSFYTEKERVSNPEEVNSRETADNNLKGNDPCPPSHNSLLEETLKKLREIEEKWGKEREAMIENNNVLKLELEKIKNSQEMQGNKIYELEKVKKTQESRISELEKIKKSQENRISELEKENNSQKKKIREMEKNSIEQNNSFKNSIGHLQKEVKTVKEENNSLKVRMEQIEMNDSQRTQESVKQNKKNEKLENNVKYLLGKSIDLENRSRRDNLRIIGLPENYDQKKSLDSILQEIIKENCPETVETEGKVDVERIHRTPSEIDPKKRTPRNIVAKLQNYHTKEKILQAARKKQFKYQGATIRVTQDLAASTLKDRRAWNLIFHKAKDQGLQPRMNYPAKFSIFFHGRRWSFNETEEFYMFLRKKPDLNKKFDLHPQD
ncbi:uncharacterized protein LOC141555273 [Sminthopsis crassicaudata]|uniref:uncharacterized protein LOC141555273 n=1 Tax=Sminthopsis crassicaudata TaxID=9301 RepID=UPI003D6950E4